MDAMYSLCPAGSIWGLCFHPPPPGISRDIAVITEQPSYHREYLDVLYIPHSLKVLIRFIEVAKLSAQLRVAVSKPEFWTKNKKETKTVPYQRYFG